MTAEALGGWAGQVVSDAAAAALAPAGAPGVDLLLLWHMHQPDYRDHSSGEFTMPWVYLHAIKDYADMAWHLEQQPAMRLVVNFVPVLLDQIEDYCEQFRVGPLRDPLLRLLAHPEGVPLTSEERHKAFDQCFRANHHRLIAPYPPFKRLYDLYAGLESYGKESRDYLCDRYVYDLVTWYHLAWIGETVRRESEIVAQLMAKGTGFSEKDRLTLLQVIAQLVQQIIPRYRALAQRGQIELSTTPHYHPLAPLMLDFQSAREALPEVELPLAVYYPGGRERVCAHIESAITSHARRFGAAPQGVWPAEGAVSSSFVGLLAERKIRWSASSEGVLANSLRASGIGGASADPGIEARHRPYRASAAAPGMLLFFRDDRLSDLIGFSYSKWHGRDAANNFVQELEAIAAKVADGPRPLVSVMLDGENAWEYYPYNGFFFLSDLYKGLTSHPGIRTVTGSDMAAMHAGGTAAHGASAVVSPGELPTLSAGSWVYGNFATWIGAKEKNYAWDLLCDAKASYDRVLASGRLDESARAKAQFQLADCEASDWFWWPGDYNPSESVSAFEMLFRNKLANLYRLLQLPVPDTLMRSFSKGGGKSEMGGTMRRGSTESATT